MKVGIAGERIATLSNSGAIINCLFASFSQAYGRKSAQADVASASIDGDAEDP